MVASLPRTFEGSLWPLSSCDPSNKVNETSTYYSATRKILICLPPKADAVVILNTYHEFSNPAAILEHVRRALVPGGRLVIIDRSPHTLKDAFQLENHAIAPDVVENQLRGSGFDVLNLESNL